MEFKLIRKELIKQTDKYFSYSLETEDDLNKAMSNKGKSYKGDFETQRKKFLKFLKLDKSKYLNQNLEFIKSVEDAKAFSGEFIITLDWKPSRMWGMNPRAYTNYGFEGESVGGCGYDKTSTATAQALTSNLSILKLMYSKEEQRLRKRNEVSRREYIGYGSGYTALPNFEGGVGVSSHEEIIKNLGLNMRCVSDTKHTNVYLIK